MAFGPPPASPGEPSTLSGKRQPVTHASLPAVPQTEALGTQLGKGFREGAPNLQMAPEPRLSPGPGLFSLLPPWVRRAGAGSSWASAVPTLPATSPFFS